MEILYKWNRDFRFNQLEQKKWSTSEGRPFVPENFQWIRACHLHFNRLNRKFRRNEKCQILKNDAKNRRHIPLN